MPLDNTTAVYAAIFAGLSAIAGIIAAIAALRSANAARALVVAQAQGEKRRLALKFAKLAQEILSKAKSLNRLCDEVKSQYDSLAVFTGNVGGNRHKLFKDRIEENRTDIAKIVRYIEEVSPTGESIEEMTEHRIGELLIVYTMKREELFELASILTGEKAELQSQLSIYQEKAIKS